VQYSVNLQNARCNNKNNVQLCLWYNFVLPSSTCVVKRFIGYEHQMQIKYNFRTAAMLFFYILHHIKVKILISIYYQTKPQDPKISDASAAPTSQILASAMLLFIIYIYIYIYIYTFFPVALRPNAGHGSSILRFLDHIKRHTTVCKTPLGEWSARRRDLYLTTHDSHNKYPWPWGDSSPHFQQASGYRTTP
jgi:hypothetical protein